MKAVFAAQPDGPALGHEHPRDCAYSRRGAGRIYTAEEAIGTQQQCSGPLVVYISSQPGIFLFQSASAVSCPNNEKSRRSHRCHNN